MSIYLEFPSIAEYPFYINPFKNDDQLFFPEEIEVQEAKDESTPKE